MDSVDGIELSIEGIRFLETKAFGSDGIQLATDGIRFIKKKVFGTHRIRFLNLLRQKLSLQTHSFYPLAAGTLVILRKIMLGSAGKFFILRGL